MQSQQNKFHIFLIHILITMHFPNPAKTWIDYFCSEKVFNLDMQLHQTVDLRTESTPKFISPVWSCRTQDMDFTSFKSICGKPLFEKTDGKRKIHPDPHPQRR